MKKIIPVLCLLMVACTMVFASGKVVSASVEANVEFVTNGLIVKIYYKSDNTTNAKICIKNSVGKNLFTDFVKSEFGFIKSYNFSSLSAGTYTITVSDLNGVYSAEILIKQEKKLIYKEPLPTIDGLPAFQIRQQLQMENRINYPDSIINPPIMKSQL